MSWIYKDDCSIILVPTPNNSFKLQTKNMTSKNFLAIIVLLILLPLQSYCHGVAIVDATGQAYFQLNSSNVEVTVKNQIAIVKSSQIFINNQSTETRIKFAYPLPAGANPISLRWKVNGEWKEAEVSGDSQDTTLPSNGGPGGSGGSSGTASSALDNYLGNTPLYFDLADVLEPGQSIEFEMTYVELLAYSFGEVSFQYPNKYNLIQDAPIESNTFSFRLESDRVIEQLDLMNYNESSNTNLTGTLSVLEHNGINEIPDKDYNISYRLQSNQLGIYSMSTYLTDSLVTCDEFGKGFVSLIIEPESNAEVEVIQKNFTLIIDRSGSMNGEKIIQAKDAAKFIINNLNSGDKFNIIDFSSGINSFSEGHAESTDQNIQNAISYIDEINAGGSTNINDALLDAISEFSAAEPDKANIIIFFTDGEATVGITNTSQILENVNGANNLSESNVFLFTFGIGESVNKPLLTLLARENSGLVNFLENQELEEEITNFFLKVNNPVLINTSIEITPAGSIQSFHPSLVPNLYKGQQLIISGRYLNPQDVNITLEGMAFNLPVSYDFPISLSDSTVVDQSFLPKIWAKQKIDELSLDYLIEEDQSQADIIQNQIDELSTCYSVVSVAFSSFEDSSLEVDLVNFEISQKEEDVILEWTTAVEINNEEFVIERSQNGIEFQEIGRVQGAGNSTETIHYLFVDRSPFDGIAYYRLKQIDLDGHVSYSEVKVIVIENKVENTRYLLYPNPLPQGENLFIDSNNDSEISIQIINPLGKIIFQDLILSQDLINIPELTKGSYLVELKVKEKSQHFTLFVR